jgi:hypothetical protein
VPYGTGLRQRLFVEAAALRFGVPRKTTSETQGSDGSVRVDFAALTRTAMFELPPVPSYLLQAVHAMAAHKYVEADGLSLRALDAKQTDVGDNPCRWTLSVNLEETTVLVSRGCPTPLPVLLDGAGYEPRGWRCGDASDVEPDWQDDPTLIECEQDGNPDWQDDLSLGIECEQG